MYNQKYHQFDTFYNHKFGFHITGPQQKAFDDVFRLRPRVVKTLDFSVDVMKRIRREIPDVFLIGRLFVHPQEFGGSTQEARQKGREMAERILREEVNQDRHQINGRPVFDAWESLNEIFPEWTDDDTQRRYDEYQVAFGDRLRSAGFEPIAFNFGQGNGRGESWLRLYPGTLETYKYLGFHEYDWPTLDRLHQIGVNGPVEQNNWVPIAGQKRGNDGMWRCLRYRRIMYEGIRQKYGDRHVAIITECGMTQGVWGGAALDIGPWAKQLTVPNNIPGGVVSTPIPVDEYWRTLQWYNSELMKDDFVMGACLFVTGATGQWETFEHLGPIMDRLFAFQKTVAAGSNPTTAALTPTAAGAAVEPKVASAKTETPATTTSVAKSAPDPQTQKQPEPQPQSVKKWTYQLRLGAGLPLLIGDIGQPNETIFITRPGGFRERLMSGSKSEHGRGGFETYANQPGLYKIEFLDQTFEIPLGGQFTKLTFQQETVVVPQLAVTAQPTSQPKLPSSPPVQPTQPTPQPQLATQPVTTSPAKPAGLEIQLTSSNGQTNYRPGETITLQITMTNRTAQPLSFGLVGLLLSTGHFQINTYDLTLAVNQTFQRQASLSINKPGSYTIRVATCSSPRATCVGPDGQWERREPVFTVVIQ